MSDLRGGLAAAEIDTRDVSALALTVHRSNQIHGRSDSAEIMPAWLQLDWQRMFVPSAPILETVIRGSCLYLATFGLLRIFRRQAGSIGPADLLVLLLIADAAQNGMAGEYRSITEGVLLVTTIIGWEYLFDWLGFRFPACAPFFERPPLLLISQGKIQEQHLQQELLTEDELRSQLRQKGIADVAQVQTCYLEGDGHISVIVASPPDPGISSNLKGPGVH